MGQEEQSPMPASKYGADGQPFIFGKNLGVHAREEYGEPTRENADGLPAIELTDAQRYQFDVNGWLLVPGVLSAVDVEEMREFCYRLHRDRDSIAPADRSSIGGPLQRLIDHPLVLGFMNEFVAYPPLATQEGYGFRLEGSFLTIRGAGDGRFGPHNGSGMLRLGGDSHIYRCFPGHVFSGLTRVVWELNPVEKGDGGTLVITGSHKAAFSAPPSVHDPTSSIWTTYSCPAGSVLFFTEALTHSGIPWTNSNRDRVAVFNCYNTINARWHNWEPTPEQLAAMPPKRRTLFRPVCVSNNAVGATGPF
jgi:hypothetical protein